MSGYLHLVAEAGRVLGRDLHARQTSPDATSQTSPAPTPSVASGSKPGGHTSSPLLFYVALGFGVVFTNLW